MRKVNGLIDEVELYNRLLTPDEIRSIYQAASAGKCKLQPNRPPTADPNGPYDGFEGAEVAFDGAGSADPDGDALSYDWDFGDNNNGNGPTPSHIYVDNGQYSVRLTVTDPAELSDTQTTLASIANVPPMVDVGPDQTIDEGETVMVAATFSDPGTLDTHSATIDWGDGSPIKAGGVSGSNGSGSVSGGHVYADDGTYVVTVSVIDDDGGQGVDTVPVTVNNVAPASQIQQAGHPKFFELFNDATYPIFCGSGCIFYRFDNNQRRGYIRHLQVSFGISFVLRPKLCLTRRLLLSNFPPNLY